MSILEKIHSFKNNLSKSELLVLVNTQIWEYFSTYGMTALLVIYMVNTLKLHDSNAYNIFAAYMSILYSTPIWGGYLLDRMIDEYRAVMLGGIFMIIGHFIMMYPNLNSLFIAMAFMCTGYGLFTPSLISLVGRLNNKQTAADKSFTLFYVGQNIGAFTAPIVCSIIGYKFGWNYGFGVAGAGFIIGLYFFYKKFSQKFLLHAFHHRFSLSLLIILMLGVSFALIKWQLSGLFILTLLIFSIIFFIKLFKNLSSDDGNKVKGIILLMFFMMIFFCLLSQGGTSISLFIQRIVDRNIFSFHIPSPVLLSLDPFFMFFLMPIMLWIWKSYPQLHVADKFIFGLFAIGSGFIVLSIGAFVAKLYALPISFLYIVLTFTLFPLAELCIMPIGYSLVTRYTPNKHINMLIGIWILGQSLARFLAGKLALLSSYSYGKEFNLVQASNIYLHAFSIIAVIAFIAIAILFLLRRLLQKLLPI